MNPTNRSAFLTPSSDERRKMIEIAAYYLAECRGFAPGGAEADWLCAEQAINAIIADRRADRTDGASAHRGGHPDDVVEGIRNALKLSGGLSG